ncbi:MAG: endo-1,4-beta-xylanase [Mangrovibacterium sp.]
MNKLFLLLVLIGVNGLLLSCGSSGSDDPIAPPAEEPEPPKNNRPKNIGEYNQTTDGLKDYYTQSGYFDVGVAIEPNALDDAAAVTLMKRHFNSLTAENVMKWSSLQPTEGNFNWANADKIVSFAQANELRVRGHTLCWHSQVPDWIFTEDGQTASKEKVLQRLRDHITAVVGHFKGKVYAWDVVNEAVADDGGFRASNWYNICGTDYIVEAFRAARAADPDAKLFYNDYNATSPIKRNKIYELLELLKSEFLVDGVGLQGHWQLDNPSNSYIRDAFDKYKSLGLVLQITEMDVSTGSAGSYTTSVENDQANAYSRYFTKFREYKTDITSVTFWALNDAKSWLNKPGSPNFPMLFDADYRPKKSYFKVIDF